MRITYDRILFALIALCLAVSGCTGPQVAVPTTPLPSTALPTLPATDTPVLPATVVVPTIASTITASPSVTVTPIPEIALRQGDFYFSIAGTQNFIFSRNAGGYQPSQYYQFLDLTKTGGSKLVRIQLDSLGMGYTHSGTVDEIWASQWDQVFDKANANGIYIIPVFSGWFDWNAGSGYSTWKSNPLNEANGGFVKTPAELFQSQSATQKIWLQWVKTLVDRWQARKNIAAWEIFSEVNLSSGASESAGIDFVKNAASVIRASDPGHRPITASLADDGKWPDFYRLAPIDFVNVHPYPPSGQLDRNVILGVRQVLATYNKPVLIGESGLSADTPDSNPATLTTAANASIGIKHAIWAGLVSGAMNGRSLYWEDGFAIYFPALSLPFIQKFADADLPASNFVRDVDFSGFKPLTSRSSGAIFGAVLGNEKMVIAWFRDARCEPPDWNLQPMISNQTVAITVPGSAPDWQVDFYNTKTGTDILSSIPVARQGNTLLVPLPDFTDDIAFRMYVKPGSPPAPVPSVSPAVLPTHTPAPSVKPAPTSTDPIAGKWTGMITAETGNFIAQIDLSIQPGCTAGSVCGQVSTPQPPCTGSLFLKEINGDTFVFVEQDMAGASTCISGGLEHLQLQADGTLSFRYTLTLAQGAPLASSGVLMRP